MSTALKIGDKVALRRRSLTGRNGVWTVEDISGRSITLRYPDGTTASTVRQDFKRVNPNSNLPHCLRSTMPYGMFTCADGRDVLFDRNYKPMLQRINGVVTAANPDEWIDWTLQRFYFDDVDPPWLSAATRARCEAVLSEWRGGLKADAPWRFGLACEGDTTRIVIPRTEPPRRRSGAR